MVQAVKNQVAKELELTKSEAQGRRLELSVLMADAEEVYVMIGKMNSGIGGFTRTKLLLSHSAPDHGLFEALSHDDAGFSTKEEWLAFLEKRCEEKGYHQWLADLLDRLLQGCMMARFRFGVRDGACAMYDDRAWAQQKLDEAARRYQSVMEGVTSNSLTQHSLSPEMRPPETDFAATIASMELIPSAPPGMLDFHRDVAMAAAMDMMMSQNGMLDRALVDSQQHEAKERVSAAYAALAKEEHRHKLRHLRNRVDPDGQELGVKWNAEREPIPITVQAQLLHGVKQIDRKSQEVDMLRAERRDAMAEIASLRQKLEEASSSQGFQHRQDENHNALATTEPYQSVGTTTREAPMEAEREVPSPVEMPTRLQPYYAPPPPVLGVQLPHRHLLSPEFRHPAIAERPPSSPYNYKPVSRLEELPDHLLAMAGLQRTPLHLI